MDKYAVIGPGMSGTTNSAEEAGTWLVNNPDACLYFLAGSNLAEDRPHRIGVWDYQSAISCIRHQFEQTFPPAR